MFLYYGIYPLENILYLQFLCHLFLFGFFFIKIVAIHRYLDMKPAKILVKLDDFLDSYNFYTQLAKHLCYYLLNLNPMSKF